MNTSELLLTNNSSSSRTSHPSAKALRLRSNGSLVLVNNNGSAASTIPPTAAFGSDGLGNVRVARATFDPSGNTARRTVAAHTLGVTIPAGAIILGGFIDVITTFTSASADAGTIAISVEGAGDLVAAIAISDASNVWDAGLRGIKPGNPNLGADAAHDSQLEVAALNAGTLIKTTEARLVTATVAVAALTAGKAVIYIKYVG